MKLPYLLPFCWWFCASLPAQERLLPPTFQPGFRYVIRSQQTVETVLGAGTPNAGKQIAGVTLELVAACRADAQYPGCRNVSVELAKVGMNVVMGGLKMSYDSSQPDGGETLLGESFKGLIGKSFQLILDSEDKIIEVKGRENFSTRASPLSQQVGVDQLTQMVMPMLTLGLPPEGVVPGQSWDHVKDSSLGPAGKLQASYRVTYHGDEEGIAVCQYQGELRLHPDASGQDKPPASRISLENGRLSGTMRVDKTQRFPSSGSGEGSLTMTVPGPSPAEPITLPVTQHRSFELLQMRPIE